MIEDISIDNAKFMFDITHALYKNVVPTGYVYLMNKDLKHIPMSDFNR